LRISDNHSQINVIKKKERKRLNLGRVASESKSGNKRIKPKKKKKKNKKRNQKPLQKSRRKPHLFHNWLINKKVVLFGNINDQYTLLTKSGGE